MLPAVPRQAKGWVENPQVIMRKSFRKGQTDWFLWLRRVMLMVFLTIDSGPSFFDLGLIPVKSSSVVKTTSY